MYSNKWLLGPGEPGASGEMRRSDEQRARTATEVAQWRAARLEENADPYCLKHNVQSLDLWYAQTCLVCLSDLSLNLVDSHMAGAKHLKKYKAMGGARLRKGILRPDPTDRLPPTSPADLERFCAVSGFTNSRILTLGEQDFSFALQIAFLQHVKDWGQVKEWMNDQDQGKETNGIDETQANGKHPEANDHTSQAKEDLSQVLVATSCFEKESLPTMGGYVESNLEGLANFNVEVRHGVDAQDLHGTLLSQSALEPFDTILFPFPRSSRHGGQYKNSQLLGCFFNSVRKAGLLTPGGSIQLIMPVNQYAEWDTACMALESGFELHDKDVLPPGFYICREMTGKSWTPKNAELYIFRSCGAVCIPRARRTASTRAFTQAARDLFKRYGAAETSSASSCLRRRSSSVASFHVKETSPADNQGRARSSPPCWDAVIRQPKLWKIDVEISLTQLAPPAVCLTAGGVQSTDSVCPPCTGGNVEWRSWRKARLQEGADPSGLHSESIDWWYSQLCLVCLTMVHFAGYPMHAVGYRHKANYKGANGFSLRPGVQRPPPEVGVPVGDHKAESEGPCGFAESRVLVIGEQDYSFSVQLARLQHELRDPEAVVEAGHKLVATSYLAEHDPSEPEIHVSDDGERSTYTRRSLPPMGGMLFTNLKQVAEFGGLALHSVDARNLQGTLLTQRSLDPFDVIIFPFPRASLRRGQDPTNSQLLWGYFKSCKESGLLARGGTVQLIMLASQYAEWDVVCMGLDHGFELCGREELPPGFYQSREMSGKAWSPKNAELYMFRLVQQAIAPEQQQSEEKRTLLTL